MTDAESYLKEMADASEIELGKDLQTKAGDPTKVDFGDRDIYYIYYTYKDKDAGGTVACAYYAENLEDGSVAVYNSTAPMLSTASSGSRSRLSTSPPTARTCKRLYY